MSEWILKGQTGDWEIVVGLEVHAQIVSQSKLFSGASATYGAAPNENVSLVDAAFPGVLPVLNEECVAQAVRTGLALKAEINKFSQFDRKNYFYADLPQGYQISQFFHPIVGKGMLTVEMSDGTEREIGITRLHLEQDAGKSLHDQDPTKSYIDLNRAGVGLMEIVSEPDIRSPEAAGAYVRKLRQILRYTGSCDGNMEEGSMRADVNVSVRPVGEEGYRTRCEIKNVNSIRFVMQAVEVEAKRQVEAWEAGKTVDQETRLFDSAKGETRSLRTKENAQDYRYFPDPDLLPVRISDEYIEKLCQGLPELPDDKRARLEKDYGINAYESGILTMESGTADFYEAVAKGRDPRLAVNWVLGDFFAGLNRTGKSLENSPVSAEALNKLLGLIEDKTINGKIAKEVLEDMIETGEDPEKIIDKKGLRQVTDTGAILKECEAVVAENEDKVAEYKSGKDRLFGFFVGQVMKRMRGKANPAVVNEELHKILDK